jgi:hypothetical protein
MLFKGSCDRVLSGFRVQRGQHCNPLLCRTPPWSLKLESTSPVVAYPYTGTDFYILNIELVYQTMPSRSPHRDPTSDVRNVRSPSNCQNQQQHGPSGNSQLPPAKRRVSVPAGERDSSQGGSSIPSTIQGQNDTRSSSLSISCVADVTQHVTTNPSATHQWLINTSTAKLGTSSRSTPVPGGTSMGGVVSSPASGIAPTPTPLSNLENRATPNSNPVARAIITILL